jgi:ankyrin repeat protein
VWLVLLGGAAVASASDFRLLEAVRNQDREAVRALLKQHVDVNAPHGDGATALHWAAHRDDVETADLLIRAGANVNAANDLGVTPIALACANGSAAMVEKLLAAGANPNAVASGEPALMTAARTGSVGAVKALLARGADVNARDGVRGQTALMWAVAHNHAEVARILVEKGAQIHARSNVSQRIVSLANRYGGVRSRARGLAEHTVVAVEQGGSTALLFAARNGALDAARILVAARANVNDAASDGTSALVGAAHSGHGALATFLLEHGANPNLAGSGYTALHAAVLRGDLNLVKALLAHGANPSAHVMKGTPVRRFSKDFALNAAWVGATPFWLATRFGEIEMMRVLAAAGADAVSPTADGTTPLIALASAGIDSGQTASDRRERRLDALEVAAMRARHDEDVRTVLEVAALAVSLGGDVNAANKAGDTALHRAAAKGSNKLIEFLVERGARLDVENKRGKTPLAIASRSGPPGSSNTGTAALLRKLGPKSDSQ